MNIRISILLVGGASLLLSTVAGVAAAGDGATYNNQLFFRGAYSSLSSARDAEVFTDALGTTKLNDDKGGWSIAAGLDLSAMQIEKLGGANLMGEIFLEYSHFSDKRVQQATSLLLGGNAQSEIAITELNVTVAPKARFDGLGNGRIRPFVIPIGLAFLVNSPPSNDTSYLDVGLHFGAGVDVLVVDRISVGADVRYTHGFESTNTNMRYWSTGIYAALNF
jgi:hypothetical protein